MGKALGGEPRVGEGDVQGRALAQAPGAFGAPGAPGGQLGFDASAAQFPIADSAAFPLLPLEAPELAADPLVQVRQDARCFAEAEVAAPPTQVAPQVLDHPLHADAPIPPRQLPDPLLEA